MLTIHSYNLFHLQGPATMFTTTGYSSSIQAVHLARQCDLLISCDMAKGVTLDVSLITKTGHLKYPSKFNEED